MRKYVTEFIGTFGLVFTVGCAVMSGSALAPLAIGAALMVFVYAGGHISGGHYNPAVSLGVFLRGNLARADLVPYWVAQFAGAFLAAWLARFTVNPIAVPTLSTSGAHAGFTVGAGAFAVGGVSGGAFNPAVVFGAMLMGLIDWGNFYIYLIGNALGAVVAALAFRYLNPQDIVEGPLVSKPAAEAAPAAAAQPDAASGGTPTA